MYKKAVSLRSLQIKSDASLSGVADPKCGLLYFISAYVLLKNSKHYIYNMNVGNALATPAERQLAAGSLPHQAFRTPGNSSKNAEVSLSQSERVWASFLP